MFVDYYKVLEIPATASQAEIQKAYRRAAMKWHPDRYKGADANERMASVNEAYCILRDPEARRKYDAELQRYQSLFGSRT